MFNNILEKNWLEKVENYKVDTNIAINIPLLKVKEYILKEKENSLYERYVQISVDYFLTENRHPFFYLENIPIELMKSVFNEIGNEKGIEFSIKMQSCIAEVQAFQKLLKIGFTSNDNFPSKKLEDDFYISNKDKNFAFEVKSKLSEDFYLEYVQNYIQGKMLLNNYKKSIGLNIETKIKQENLQKLLNFLDKNILIETNINDIIHYKNKQCFSNTCFSSENENEIIIDFRNESKTEYDITVRTIDLNMLIMIKEKEIQFNGGVCKTAIGVTKIDIKTINNFLIKIFSSKLEEIIKQYKNEKKLPFRKSNKFGGFIFLQIPWYWTWLPNDISNIFIKLVKKILKNQKIYFPIYVYLHQYESKNLLLSFNIINKFFRKKRMTKYKTYRIKK